MTATISPAALPPGRVTQLRVLHAEWIKLRSLRSTWFSLLASVVIIVGLGTLFSEVRAHRFGDPRDLFFDPTQVSLRGVFLAQLAIGVLGVLVIAGEYTTGMIRSSLAAVPHRQPVLLAKVAVFALLAFVTAEIAAFCAFVFGQQALKITHLQASLSTPHAWRAILGAGIYITLIGLLGVGLGFLLRNTAGAIAVLVSIVLVLPLLAEALPSPYSTDVLKYLPLNAGTQIMTLHPDGTGLGPWAGLGITALYTITALVAGSVQLARNDA
jgi:ABC-2 type transport system permease protein